MFSFSEINLKVYRRRKRNGNEGVNVVRSLNDNQAQNDGKRNKMKSLRNFFGFC